MAVVVGMSRPRLVLATFALFFAFAGCVRSSGESEGLQASLQQFLASTSYLEYETETTGEPSYSMKFYSDGDAIRIDLVGPGAMSIIWTSDAAEVCEMNSVGEPACSQSDREFAYGVALSALNVPRSLIFPSDREIPGLRDVKRLRDRAVLGRPARCYGFSAPSQGTGELCFDTQRRLVYSWADPGYGKRVISAVSVSADVDDSVFSTTGMSAE